MSKNPFKKLDELSFKGVDQLKGTTQFNQAASYLEGLPDEFQKYINQGLTYLITIIPFALLGVVLLFNLIQRGSIADKEQLIRDLVEVTEFQAKAKSVGNDLVSPRLIKDQNDLQRKLGSIAASLSLSPNDLKVGNFNMTKFGELNKVEAVINFQKLSTPKLVALLDDLSLRQKAKIKHVNFSKVGDTINGDIEFMHFARGQAAQ